MFTLTQALFAVSSILEPSARFSRPKIKLKDGILYVYNGQVAAHAPFTANLPPAPLVLDAEAFRKVWTDQSRADIKDDALVIKTRRTQYKIPFTHEFDFDCPTIVPGGRPLSEKTRAAIHMAANFASENAIHPWACGVALHKSRAIATNNIAVVSVECDDTDQLEGTLPFWAVKAIRATGTPPLIRLDKSGVILTYGDGVVLWSMPLAVEMPAKLFELVADLAWADVPSAPLREALGDAFALGGKHCKLDLTNGVVSVTAEHGFSTETRLEQSTGDYPVVTLQDNVARLIFEHATAIGFDQAPGKLVFSRDIAPRFLGLCAAMT